MKYELQRYDHGYKVNRKPRNNLLYSDYASFVFADIDRTDLFSIVTAQTSSHIESNLNQLLSHSMESYLSAG